MPIASAALIVLMQAGIATVDPETPLEAGRWVVRSSIEQATGLGGISTALLSNDGNYRLTVRCDFAYSRNISIQFLRDNGNVAATSLPVRLARTDGGAVHLVWEQSRTGAFARDSDTDPSATQAAAVLANYYGELLVSARDQSGAAIQVTFDALEGHQGINRTIAACAPLPGK